MKVLLGIPHALLREGIRDILKRWSTVRVVGSTPSAADAVRLIERLQPDVLVISRSGPAAQDAEAVSAARSGPRACRVVLVEGLERRSRRDSLGADRTVSGSVGPAGLIRAMWEACNGPDAGAGSAGAADKSARQKEPRQLLTGREYEVARAVCEGHPNREIARRLGISEKTVKNHLSSIYRRTGVAGRTQLLLWALRRGLGGDGADT